MIEEDGFETVYQSDKPALITLTLGAYETIQAQAALEERLRVLAWLRRAEQPMIHTAWALAKGIETGEHLK